MQHSCGLVSLNVLFNDSFGLFCTDLNMKEVIALRVESKDFIRCRF